MQFLSDFSEFKPWSGAVEVYERIVQEKSVDDLENALDQIFADDETPPTATAINDLLWFDSDTVYNMLGMVPDSAKKRTLDEIRKAWKENDPVGYEVQKVEIIDDETIRVTYFDPEEKTPPEEYETEDLNPEEIAGLFDDDCAEIDDEKEIVKTWKEG